MNTTLVTGASSGIGLALAELFAKDGSDLVIVARREEILNSVADRFRKDYGVKVQVIPKDLTLKDAPEEIFNEVEKLGLEINTLVNNAGFGLVGEFSDMDYKQQMQMIDLNVNALVSLTRLFIPKMIEKNSGGILNVGSLAGFQPGPYATIYYATKSFVLSFTEGLYEELKGKNIKISCLAPGPVDTEFGQISGLDRSPLFKFGTMNVKEVAAEGYTGFKNGKLIIIPGLLNRFLPILVRFSPRFLVRIVTSKLNKNAE